MYHSFMVRIWQKDQHQRNNFRISAESVQSGEKYEFSDLAALHRFLDSYTHNEQRNGITESRSYPSTGT